MARYEVFRNSGIHANDVPYLLDVQSDLLHGLDTRVVIPLRRCDRFTRREVASLFRRRREARVENGVARIGNAVRVRVQHLELATLVRELELSELRSPLSPDAMRRWICSQFSRFVYASIIASCERLMS